MDFLDLDIFILKIPTPQKKTHGDIVTFWLECLYSRF